MKGGLLDAMRAWRDARATLEIAEGAKGFLGKPGAWYERPHWFCENGHVSGAFLKCDDGDRCLDCRKPVILGPTIGEAAFAPILVSLKSQGDS